MRQIISFLVACGLIAVSGYFLYLQAFHSTEIRGAWLIGAVFFGTIGIGWLWEDFIAPLFRQAKKD